MADVGTGITIAFGTNTSLSYEILDVQPFSAAREFILTSHMGTTSAHTKLPKDLADWGQLVVEVAYDADSIASGYAPPINDVAETITVTYPKEAGKSTAAYFTASGFMTNFTPKMPFEDKMTASFTVEWSGAPTFHDGA